MADLAVLFVSDDPRVRDAATTAFGPEVLVHVVDDARAASAWLRDALPDVAVIDIQTGSAGGFALRRDMDQDPELAKVPVVMLLERKQDVWLAKQAGADVILTKPIGAIDLTQAVHDTLARA